MILQKINDFQRILYMAFHTKAQCLDTLQQNEGVEGRDGSAGVAQDDGTDAGDVGSSAYSIGENDAVIRGIGLRERGELVVLPPSTMTPPRLLP